jgi:hypothetical protein
MNELLIIGSILGFITLVLFRELGLVWCRLCFTFWASLASCLVFDNAHNFALVFLFTNLFYWISERIVPE